MHFFQYPDQSLLINEPEQNPLLFYKKLPNGRFNLLETGDVFDATGKLVQEGEGFHPDPDGVMADPDGAGAGVAITLADIARLKVVNFMDFDRGAVIKARKNRGISEQIKKATLTWTLHNPDIGGEIGVEIHFKSWDEKADFANWNADYASVRLVVLYITAGETEASLAAKLTKALSNQGNKETRQFPLKVSDAGGVNSFEGRDGFTDFTIRIKGITQAVYHSTVSDQVALGKVEAVFAVTQAHYLGRNNYPYMRQLRPETGANTYPYAVGTDVVQKAVKGVLYTHFHILCVHTPTHTQLMNSHLERKFGYNLYLNERTCGAQIAILTQFFNSVALVKEDYPATTPADVLDGETPGSSLT